MNDFDQNSDLPQRSTLVTVLAILTIVWSAISLVLIFLPSDIFARGMSDTPQPPEWINYSSIGLHIVKIVGAVFLLKMKKIGFYLYTAGELVLAIFMIIGTKIALDFLDSTWVNPDIPVDPKIFIIAGAAIGLALSVVWIGAYATQLGKMR